SLRLDFVLCSKSSILTEDVRKGVVACAESSTGGAAHTEQRGEPMRIGVKLGPTANWSAVLAAAKAADASGFDAVGVLDHYHSAKPEWGWVCGWSFYGALALATTSIKLVPQVICHLNYLPGVLAKETTVLALLSGRRFELGIGAGDYFE